MQSNIFNNRNCLTTKCKFCGRDMNTHYLGYLENQYCNLCFEDRVNFISLETNTSVKENTISFFGEEIMLDDSL